MDISREQAGQVIEALVAKGNSADDIRARLDSLDVAGQKEFLSLAADKLQMNFGGSQGTFEPDVETKDGKTFTPDAPKQYASAQTPKDPISGGEAFLAGTASGAATEAGAAKLASKVTGESPEAYKEFTAQASEDAPIPFAVGQLTGFFAGLPSKLFKGAELAAGAARFAPRGIKSGLTAAKYGQSATKAAASAISRGSAGSFVGKTTAGFLGGEAALGAVEAGLEGESMAQGAKDRVSKTASDPWSLLLMGAGEAAPVVRAVKSSYRSALEGVARRGINNLPEDIQAVYKGKNLKEASRIIEAGPKKVVQERTQSALSSISRVAEKQKEIAQTLKENITTKAADSADEMRNVLESGVESLGNFADHIEAITRVDAKAAQKVAQRGLLSLSTQIEAIDDAKKAWATARYEPIKEANKAVTVKLPGNLWEDFLDSGFVRVGDDAKLAINPSALEEVPHYHRQRVAGAVNDLIGQFNRAKLGDIRRTKVVEVEVPFNDALNIKKGVNALGGFGAKNVSQEASGFRKIGEQISNRLYESDASGKLRDTDVAFREASEAVKDLRKAMRGPTGVQSAIHDIANDIPSSRAKVLTRASMSMDNLFSAHLTDTVQDYVKASEMKAALPKTIGGLRKQLVSQLESGKELDAGAFQSYLTLHNRSLLSDTFAQQLSAVNPNIPRNVPEVLKRAVAGEKDALKMLKDLGVDSKDVQALENASKRMAVYGQSTKKATKIIREMSQRGKISPEQEEVLSLISAEFPEVRKLVEGIEFAKKVEQGTKGSVMSGVSQRLIKAAAGGVGGSLGYSTAGHVGSAVGAAGGYGTADVLLELLANPGRLATHLYKTKMAANFPEASKRAIRISNIFSKGILALASQQTKEQE